MVNILGIDVTSGYLKIKIFRSQNSREKELLMRLEARINGSAKERERFDPVIVPLARD